ncbi:unnamed protein product [Tuber melanosporum]|uniref:(Perigord truffle) hypothetical protein n=1 Tax=Tuber melanosporum (strain Mel28) TaxID=656061 RepID=D5GBE8_TUBMM|nr:uncharacterized protein GSTUM_00000437001 [Tuber melanosporum]CAZ81841.1 unnamed protein product [Tuber melanosporum]
MGEKRKRTVAVRESHPSKHRSATPAAAEAPTPEEQTPTPEVPTSFTKDGPLPVIPQRQPGGLLLSDYQSVAESKVMAESLIRSQRKWVDGDIFEKFWIKPLKSRKLDPAELEKNPSKDCMTRLGNCTMSSMPHKFEIKLFGVLEPLDISENTTSGPGFTAHHAQSSGAGVQTPPAHHQVPQQGVARAPDLARTQSSPASVTPVPHQRPTGNPGISPQPSTPGQPSHQGPQLQPSHPAQQDPPRVAPPPAASRPDPVIQALAIRAASDPDLKALMRIVASGKATTEQLKIFQAHIDVLTPVASSQLIRSHAARPSTQTPGPSVTLGSGHTAQAPHQQTHPGHQQRHQQQPQLQHTQQPQPQHQHQHHPQQHHQQQYHQHQTHSQSHSESPQFAHHPLQCTPSRIPVPHPAQTNPKPRPFPQPPKQEITSVVFEFVDPYSQGDRFLFPKHAILEYLKGGTVVRASFILVRKPVDDLDEYYQPITVVLESATPKPLEILQRVVASAENTLKHMEEIMASKKRAEDTFLVFRLRREPGEAIPDKPEMHEMVEASARTLRERRARRESSTPAHDLKNFADTPQAAPPRPRVKTIKKAIPREPTTQPSIPSPSTSAVRTPVPKMPKTPRPPKPPRSRKGRIADPTKSCHICQTSKTSLWRKADIEGENVTVCNACGIKWKTNAQKAAQAATQGATSQPLPTDRASSSSGIVGPATHQLVAGAPQMQCNQRAVGLTANDLSGQQVHAVAYQISSTTAASSAPVPSLQHHPQLAVNLSAPQPSLPQQDGNSQQSSLTGGLQLAGSSGENGAQSLPLVNDTPQGLVSGAADRPPLPLQSIPEKPIDQNSSMVQDSPGGLGDIV